jgi:hypothetical protein
MVPFLVDMCIFAFPRTFVTSVFPVSTKKCIFHFLGGRRGQNRFFLWSGHQGQCAKPHHSNF